MPLPHGSGRVWGWHNGSRRKENLQMNNPKRSFCLPAKLVTAFDKEAEKQGVVREKVVAAAILMFIESDPNYRAAIFDRPGKFLDGKAR